MAPDMTEAYDGMLEVAHAQQWGKTLQETEDCGACSLSNVLAFLAFAMSWRTVLWLKDSQA